MLRHRLVWVAPLFLLSCSVLSALAPPKETLSTSYKKPMGKTLDGDEIPFAKDPRRLDEQPRSPTGEWSLAPGSYEMSMPSFCLHAGKGGGGKGTAYLAAKLEGPKAKLIDKLVERAAWHTYGTGKEYVNQQELQTLIWAVLARAKLDPKHPGLGNAIRLLLSEDEIKEINDDRLEVFSGSIMKRMQMNLPREAREALEAENKMRGQFENTQTSYAEMEAVAVPRTGDEGPGLGVWTETPGGYYIRFFPDSYQKTKVQIYVPAKPVALRGGGASSMFLLASGPIGAPVGDPSGGSSCTPASMSNTVAAPNDANRQRLLMGPTRDPAVTQLKNAKTDDEVKAALGNVAKGCEEKINSNRGYHPGKPPPPEECAELGTAKHACAEDSINEAQNPRVMSEVAYDKKGKPLPPRDTPEGNKCRGKVYEELVNKQGRPAGAPGTIASADCGGFMCADVVVLKDGATTPSKGNVAKAFDFKFPCGDNEPSMSNKQKGKYKKVFGFEPELISPGGP